MYKVSFLVPTCEPKSALSFFKDGKRVKTEYPWPGGFLQNLEYPSAGDVPFDLVTISRPFSPKVVLWEK